MLNLGQAEEMVRSAGLIGRATHQRVRPVRQGNAFRGAVPHWLIAIRATLSAVDEALAVAVRTIAHETANGVAGVK